MELIRKGFRAGTGRATHLLLEALKAPKGEYKFFISTELTKSELSHIMQVRRVDLSSIQPIKVFTVEEDNRYFITKTQEQGQAAVEDLIFEAEIRGLDEIAKAINEYVALGKPVRANLNFIERTLRDTIISNGSKIK